MSARSWSLTIIRTVPRLVVVLLWAASAWTSPLNAATVYEPSTGITLTVDPSGPYTITVDDPAWTFGGDIGRPLTDLAVNTGTDNVGDYQEITFNYVDGVATQGGIRTYRNRSAVLFTVTYLGARSNTAPFPELTTYPQNLYHLTYNGIFGIYAFDQLGKDSPWLFFDSNARAFILSPAMNFMVAATTLGDAQAIRCGIDSRIAVLPQGFTHQTFLVVDKGINQAFETWGNALTDLQGKNRPANHVDLSLAYLGYWTDNGATYYYQYEPSRGYAGTLLALKDYFDQQGIPVAYMQLDSWFYPKGPQQDWREILGGIYEYVADPSLFPQGLKAFQQQLGLPLIVHSRWIDPSSPYRQQYRVSGNVAIDPLYWSDITAYIKDAGVVTFEQDWLGAQAQTDFNLTDPDAFMDNMAIACQEKGLTMQYCMPLPRHYLESSLYDNITTIRTSGDRFNRDRWDSFLYGSRLASALGVWPWSDVFMSTELENLLLSTLSAGPVGVGDRLGAINKANLLRAVRPDGVIVKPDVPLVPLDATFVNDAQGLTHPMVASTYTDFGTMRASYVFAYSRGPGDRTTTFVPADLGLSGPVYVYNYFTGRGGVQDAGDAFSEPMTNDRAYYILVPIGDSGIGFLGDADQFVSLGKNRIIELADDGTLEVTIEFAYGDTTRTIHGYSPSAPVVTALSGSADPPVYDASTQRFRVAVSPGPDGLAILDITLSSGQ